MCTHLCYLVSIDAGELNVLDELVQSAGCSRMGKVQSDGCGGNANRCGGNANRCLHWGGHWNRNTGGDGDSNWGKNLDWGADERGGVWDSILLSNHRTHIRIDGVFRMD